MLQKLNAVTAKQEAKMPEILSTHPITQERVVRVRELLPEAYALHQENCSRVQDLLGRFAAEFADPVRFQVGSNQGNAVSGLTTGGDSVVLVLPGKRSGTNS
eukprot:GHUV01020182.1.p1 GENE.GHUV01020182.1~~GHUV01020182.1.p1  ORF type:complete len:102 (+),score=16.00 GHUV01020182.1:727-1032(+)